MGSLSGSAARRSRVTLTPGAIFLIATAALFAVLLLRNNYLFTAHIAEGGDQGLNSLLVERAAHLRLTIGNYSRVGFHHPGPAFLYLLAAGEALFHDTLHVVPTPFNGQLLGVFLADSIMLGLVVRICYVVTRSVPATALAFGVIVLFAGTQRMLSEMWFPYLYMAPFVLLVVAGTAVAVGYTGELASYVFAGALLIHGHVSFIAFVGATTIAVLVGWLLVYRGEIRAELADRRRTLLVSGGILALFALPIVVHLIAHYPGPWKDYWRYARSTDMPKHDHTLSQAWHYLGWYWDKSSGWFPVIVIAAIVGIGLTVLDRDRDRQRFFAVLYGFFVLETALYVYYLMRGVDTLDDINRYTGFFYLTVPMLVVVAAAVQVAVHARDISRHGSVVVVAGAVALFAVGAAGPKMTDSFRGDPMHTAIAAALADDPARQGRPVELTAPTWRWPTLAGITIAADRRHLRSCVQDPILTNFFTKDYICSGSTQRWSVAVIDRDNWNGRGTVVWENDSTMVLAADVTTVTNQQ